MRRGKPTKPRRIQLLRDYGCNCKRPILGTRPGVGPRCRLCNTVAVMSRESWDTADRGFYVRSYSIVIVPDPIKLNKPSVDFVVKPVLTYLAEGEDGPLYFLNTFMLPWGIRGWF